MIYDWLKAIDRSRDKIFIQIMLLDHAKAFNHIGSNILLIKLENINIPDGLFKWVESFLVE